MKKNENNSVDPVDVILQTPMLHATPPDNSKRDITFDFHMRKILFMRNNHYSIINLKSMFNYTQESIILLLKKVIT